jgi:hypothetical protein
LVIKAEKRLILEEIIILEHDFDTIAIGLLDVDPLIKMLDFLNNWVFLVLGEKKRIRVENIHVLILAKAIFETSYIFG